MKIDDFKMWKAQILYSNIVLYLGSDVLKIHQYEQSKYFTTNTDRK